MYIWVLITASLLSAGQSLWKLAGNNFNTLIKEGDVAKSIITTLFSLNFIGGALLYVAATAIYVWLFSRHSFFSVQISLISASAILSVFISYFIFKENPTIINVMGVVLIVIGIFFATKG